MAALLGHLTAGSEIFHSIEARAVDGYRSFGKGDHEWLRSEPDVTRMAGLQSTLLHQGEQEELATVTTFYDTQKSLQVAVLEIATPKVLDEHGRMSKMVHAIAWSAPPGALELDVAKTIFTKLYGTKAGYRPAKAHQIMAKYRDAKRDDDAARDTILRPLAVNGTALRRLLAHR